jgi:hypothetical protein
MANNRGLIHMLIITVGVITILILGFSSYSSPSSVSALPFQSATHHHKISDKKQSGDSIDVSSSSNSDTKRSDHFNEGNSKNINKNNNQGTHDSSNTGAGLSAAEPAKSGEQQQQGNGENAAPIQTSTPTPETTCEQGSNCTDQQSLSDRDRSTNASGPTEQEDTPFVLSLPFP